MRILVTGPFGQDGSYLIERLDGEDHELWALVHRHGDSRQEWLKALAPGVRYVEGSLTDAGSLVAAVDEVQPELIYHLGAISAPAAGWSAPMDMANVTGLGTLRILEAVRAHGLDTHVVVAGSIATHGPYGAAKTYSSTIARDFRERGMAVTTLHFGGHHSPRRAPHFFGRKVTQGAARIADVLAMGGTPDKLRLGPLGRSQDWMSAQDAVAALYGAGVTDVLENDGDGDYVVSTGQPYKSRQWVEQAFAAAGLDWREWVEHDDSFAQPTDVATLTAEPTLPGWEPTMGLTALTQWMVGADRLAP